MSTDFYIGLFSGMLYSAVAILGSLYILYVINKPYFVDYIDRKYAIKQINKAIYKSNDEAEVKQLRLIRDYLEALPRVKEYK